MGSYGLGNVEAEGLSGDASSDVQAIATYKKTIAKMLMGHRFQQLDCLADSTRGSREIFPGGMWKVHTIRLALDEPRLHPTDGDWETHLRILEQWTGRKPQSATARIALAEAYVEYGWTARGGGYSDTVSQTGWTLFEKRAGQARGILEEASKLAAKCPEWYLAMQEVALAQDWSKDEKRALYEKAIGFEPTFYYYRAYANSLLPQWGGGPGEVEQYLQRASDQVSGSAGDILYFHVADTLLCCQDEPLKLSWPRIARGFDALERQTGKSVLNWNIMARMATKSSDVATVNKMMALIGDQWSEEVWGTHGYFESVKQ